MAAGQGRRTPESIADDRYMEEVCLCEERRRWDVVERQTLQDMLVTVGHTITYYERATENVLRVMRHCEGRLKLLSAEDLKENADHDELERLVRGGIPKC